MKTKKKLELENGYANIVDPICGVCGGCWVYCILHLNSHISTNTVYLAYLED